MTARQSFLPVRDKKSAVGDFALAFCGKTR